MGEALLAYTGIGIIWAVYCLGMGYLVSEDKETSRRLLRGFWLTPVWPVIILVIIAYGLKHLWIKAWHT